MWIRAEVGGIEKIKQGNSLHTKTWVFKNINTNFKPWHN